MDIQRFKQRLQAKERELESEITRREEDARAVSEREPRDFADAATSDQITSQVFEEHTLLSQTLTEVQDALRRIEDGTFGRCIVCGRPIEPARLEAVPWTPFCLEHQQKYDQAAHVHQGGSTL